MAKPVIQLMQILKNVKNPLATDATSGRTRGKSKTTLPRPGRVAHRTSEVAPRTSSKAAALSRHRAHGNIQWYNRHRPHQSHDGLTPYEVEQKAVPIVDRPRFETRERYPVNPATTLRGEQGEKLELIVSPFNGHSHLPIIELKKAA